MTNNGGCSQICTYTGVGTRLCSCTLPYTLNVDNVSCDCPTGYSIANGSCVRKYQNHMTSTKKFFFGNSKTIQPSTSAPPLLVKEIAVTLVPELILARASHPPL